MFLRQLAYFAALAREGHFARAATACNVSQPTLSAGIARLEAEIGSPLIMRGHRYLGLTPEGRRVLDWAQRTLADYDGLRHDLGRGDGEVAGRLRLGVIPASLPMVALVTGPFCARHPRATVEVTQMSSRMIQRQLEEFEIDAGITYLENEPLRQVTKLQLYRERYLFVTRSREPAPSGLPWVEVANQPLCLLSQEMQNRRILDEVFRGLGLDARPGVETNSFVALLTHVAQGPWSTILPHPYLRLLDGPAGLAAIPLISPIHTQAVGLVLLDREPPLPLADALMKVCRRLDVDGAIDDSSALNRTSL